MGISTPLRFGSERPESEIALELIRQLDADLGERYPDEWIHGLHPEDTIDPKLLFVVAHLGDQPIGCGALRPLEPGATELKRMYVKPGFRGQGFARQLLAYLELKAYESGFFVIRLETGSKQPEAIGLYESAGYHPIPPYGEYVGNPFSVCFEKRLNEQIPE